MKNLSRLWARSKEIVGISYLSIDFINFTKMHSLFFLAVSLSGVYISTFILRSGGTVFLVSLYILLTYVFEVLGGIIVPTVSNRLRRTRMTGIGLALYACAYVTLLLFQNSMDVMFPLVAFFNSMGSAFYFGCYHGSVTEYTHPRNRQIGMSLMGIVGNFIVLVTPLLAGVITSQLMGTAGYVVIFSITLAALVFALLKSRVLPSANAIPRGYSIKSFVTRFGKDGVSRHMLLSVLFFGMRESLFAYYLNILVFQLAGNELAVGLTTTAKGIASMLLFFFMGKYLTAKFRVNGVLFMFLIMLSATVGLAFWTTVWMVVAVSVLDAVCMNFVGNSMQYSAYQVLDFYAKKHPDEDLRMVIVPVRNAMLSFGRVIGMTIFFLVPFPEGSAWSLVLFTLIAVPCALFVRLTDSSLKKAGYTA